MRRSVGADDVSAKRIDVDEHDVLAGEGRLAGHQSHGCDEQTQEAHGPGPVGASRRLEPTLRGPL
jgi:hypothetical protein